MTDASGAWLLVDHACRTCGSRIGRQDNTYRCTTCGAECRDDPSGICACGLFPGERPLPRDWKKQKPRSLFRCTPNPSKGPQNPADIVVSFAGGEV